MQVQVEKSEKVSTWVIKLMVWNTILIAFVVLMLYRDNYPPTNAVKHELIFVPIKPPLYCTSEVGIDFTTTEMGELTITTPTWQILTRRDAPSNKFDMVIVSGTRRIEMTGTRTDDILWGTYTEENGCSGFFTHPKVLRL